MTNTDAGVGGGGGSLFGGGTGGGTTGGGTTGGGGGVTGGGAATGGGGSATGGGGAATGGGGAPTGGGGAATGGGGGAIGGGGGGTIIACGNGVIEGTEVCDDNNTTAGDGCSATCAAETGFICTGTPSTCITSCGDGFVASTEQCDDNNTTAGDGCSASCQRETGFTCTGTPSTCVTTCGDGLVAGQELCDDDNTAASDGCSATCTIESGFSCTGTPSTCVTSCGDGLVAGQEQCDDSNMMSSDGCSATCATESGFTCTGVPSACVTTCGDGIKTGPEACDDHNIAAGDGCSATCSIEMGYQCSGIPLSTCSAICGDGTIIATEQCDDGNTTASDGCSLTCTVEDGFTCTGAPSNCVAVCGDGLIAGTEQCDQGAGNVANGDGCSSICRVESGYTCTGAPSVCTATCGDGVITSPETCDQGGGNVTGGDGCSAICQIESGYACSGTPSNCTALCGNGTLDVGEQCDDTNTTAGDGCTACQFDIGCGAGLTQVVATNSTATPIPDAIGAGADSAVTVTTNGSVTRAVVFFDLTHTYDADVGVYLVGPTSLRRELSTGNGTSGDDYRRTFLDDSAATTINTGTAPFSGRFRPEFSLSTTVGVDFSTRRAQGTWTLNVADTALGDTGTLNTWSLILCVNPAVTYCGDNVRNGAEECDDGNAVNADACDNNCQVTDGCGDGNLDPGEACDDNNLTSGDGCSETCQFDIACGAGETPVIITSTTAVAIPDNNTAALSSVSISTTGAVKRAIVNIDRLTHANTAQLDLFVVGPHGLTRELSTDNGGAGANYVSTQFTDSAATLITSGTAPFTGAFRPETSLSSTNGSDFVNSAAAGTWSLRMLDDTAGTTGTLNGWTLMLCINPTSAFCGDGITNGTEECDDGNFVDTDACTTACQITDGCGDGNIDPGEFCDDNNFGSGDGCSSACQPDISCGAGETPVVITNNSSSPIPDTNTGLISFITVPINGVVRRVIPQVNISHAVDAHLDLFLLSPRGVQRGLSNDLAGVNYVSTIFTDSAATAITSGPAPFTGAFRPVEAISTAAGFGNQQARGGWMLRIADDTATTSGTLNSWALALCVDTSVSTVCGNGVVETGETCDDLNTTPGDGCSATCQIELTCAVGQPVVLTSSDGPFLIQDNVPAGVNSVINVTTVGTVRSSVVVIGAIGHAFDGDLNLTLRSPLATAIDLSSQNGSGGDNFVSTMFTDSATTPILGSTAAPFRGRFRPEVALAGVNGQASAGAWTLNVADVSNADTGVLQSWSLGLCIE